MNKSRNLFLDVLREHIESGDLDIHCSNADIEPIALAQGWTVIPLWFRQDDQNPMKVGRGRYDLTCLASGNSAPVERTIVAPAAPAGLCFCFALPCPALWRRSQGFHRGVSDGL